MIVSHRHRFIFLKTKKTAGTSLEIALSGLCGPDDIITPISQPDELERRRLGYPGPQNLTAVLAGSRLRRRLRALFPGPGPPRPRNHSPAAAVRRMLPSAVWDGYFRFCFDRNPWDRAISLYHWSGGDALHGSLANFVRSGSERPFSNYDRYSIDGLVAVTRVYRYEEMSVALADIADRLGLSRPLELPEYRAKGRTRTDRRSYRDVLTEEDRELIEIVCAREIRLLGYEW